MTDMDEFFDIGGGPSAPSAKLSDRNDTVVGVVSDVFKKEFTAFGEASPQIITDPKTGLQRARTQMVVILDTEQRNWQGVSKVPDVDPSDKSKGQKHPSEDDGKRAVYIPEMVKGAGHNGIIFAVAQAIREAGMKGLPTGTQFYLTITDLKDVQKGNPLKVFEAKVKAPEAGADVFGATQPQTAPAAPQQQATPAQQAPAATTENPWTGEQTAAPAAPAQTSAPKPPPF
jgi:hypothetical protein